MKLAAINPKPNTDVSPHSKKMDWQEWEAALLVECALEHTLVNIYFPNSGNTAQSFLLGFDLSKSELLLENLHPFPLELSTCYGPVEFWLQIQANDAFFNILVATNDADTRFITVKILETGLTRNRRWEDRVYFPSKSAPKVEVQLPDTPLQNAQLANLSIGGAQVLLFGLDAKSKLKRQRTINCRIKFNQEFIIDTLGEVRQCLFLRSPCCHSVIRLKFNASASLRAQMTALIAAFHPRTHEVLMQR